MLLYLHWPVLWPLLAVQHFHDFEDIDLLCVLVEDTLELYDLRKQN